MLHQGFNEFIVQVKPIGHEADCFRSSSSDVIVKILKERNQRRLPAACEFKRMNAVKRKLL
jgi:hypothetical protein